MGKNHLLLIQLGTPGSSASRDIRRFLGDFLMDPRVIEMPALFRFLLVKGIILTFRTPKVKRRYAQIWDSETGSPLMYHSRELADKVGEALGNDWVVHLAMRFGEPSIVTVCRNIEQQKPKEIVVLPLFPQEASSTTGSILGALPDRFRNCVPDNSGQWLHSEVWMDALTQSILEKSPHNFDRLLFSFHGLPLRQVHYAHPGYTCEELNCPVQWNEKNAGCYQATSCEIARRAAKKLALPEEQYSVAFQSRFGRNWLAPQTGEVLRDLPSKGVKSVLIISPSFTADCLETSWEIDISFRKIFQKSGGQYFDWVNGLNSRAAFVQFIAGKVNKSDE